MLESPRSCIRYDTRSIHRSLCLEPPTHFYRLLSISTVDHSQMNNWWGSITGFAERCELHIGHRPLLLHQYSAQGKHTLAWPHGCKHARIRVVHPSMHTEHWELGIFSLVSSNFWSSNLCFSFSCNMFRPPTGEHTIPELKFPEENDQNEG